MTPLRRLPVVALTAAIMLTLALVPTLAADESIEAWLQVADSAREEAQADLEQILAWQRESTLVALVDGRLQPITQRQLGMELAEIQARLGLLRLAELDGPDLSLGPGALARALRDFAVAARGRSDELLTQAATALEQELADIDKFQARLEALRDEAEEVDEPTTTTLPSGFDGIWSSTYGTELVLTQSGDEVTGSYGEDEGQVRFEVAGARMLEGVWAETTSQEECETTELGSDHWGPLVLMFSEDLSSYDGTWGYCDDQLAEEYYDDWVGTYLRPRGD